MQKNKGLTQWEATAWSASFSERARGGVGGMGTQLESRAAAAGRSCQQQQPQQDWLGERHCQQLWANDALFSPLSSSSEAESNGTTVPKGIGVTAHFVQCFSILPNTFLLKEYRNYYLGYGSGTVGLGGSFPTLPSIQLHFSITSNHLDYLLEKEDGEESELHWW